MARTIADVLAAAREKIRRLDPVQARAAVANGALLVDIRPVWQRAEYGEFPAAVVIERNQLEWRLDPSSDARIREAVDHEVEVVVACQEGYTSSLAAAALLELGLHKSADLAGGFIAWRDAGLPTVPGPDVDYRGADLAAVHPPATKTDFRSLRRTLNDQKPVSDEQVQAGSSTWVSTATPSAATTFASPAPCEESARSVHSPGRAKKRN